MKSLLDTIADFPDDFVRYLVLADYHEEKGDMDRAEALRNLHDYKKRPYYFLENKSYCWFDINRPTSSGMDIDSDLPTLIFRHLSAKGEFGGWVEYRSVIEAIDDYVEAYQRSKSMSVKEMTSAEFEREVVDGLGPAIIAFGAKWCPACVSLKPNFESASQTVGPFVLFAHVDTDKEKELTRKYSVRSLPTIITFRDGKELERAVGARPADEIVKMAEKAGKFTGE